MGRLDDLAFDVGDADETQLVALLGSQPADLIAEVHRRAASAAVLHDDHLEIAIEGGSITIRVVDPAPHAHELTSDPD